MSLMLGPIHTWLFRKIVIAEERAMTLAAALAETGIDSADLRERYGEPLAGKELAALVGERSIHQFLQGLITRAQIFEASLVERGGDHLDLLMERARGHGRQVAGRLVPDGGVLSPDEIARALNDAQLEGMPCDPGATFAPLPSGEGIAYLHTACNHMNNWSFTGVDATVMCRLNNRWIAGFVEALGGDYVVAETLAEGGASCRGAITQGG